MIRKLSVATLSLAATLMAPNLCVAEDARLVITSPKADQEVGQVITLTGTAPPNSIVKCKVEWFGRDAAGTEKHGQYQEYQFAVPGDGKLNTDEIELGTEPQPGVEAVKFTLKCQVILVEGVPPVTLTLWAQGKKPPPIVLTEPPAGFKLKSDEPLKVAGTAPPNEVVEFRLALLVEQDGRLQRRPLAGPFEIKAGPNGRFQAELEVPLPPDEKAPQCELQYGLQGAKAVAGARNIVVEPAGPPPIEFELIAPPDGAEVHDGLVVAGHVTAGEDVVCVVDWFGRSARGAARGVLVEQVVKAGHDGGFEQVIDLSPARLHAERQDLVEVTRLQLICWPAGREDLKTTRELGFHYAKPPPEPEPPELPPDFPALVTQVPRGADQHLTVTYQGRMLQVRFVPESGPFVAQLRVGQTVVIHVREHLSPHEIVGIVEPMEEPVEPPGGPPRPPPGELGPPRRGTINTARVIKNGFPKPYLLIELQGRPYIIFVGRKTAIHKGPHVRRQGEIKARTIIDARGTIKEGRWIARDITLH